MTATAGSPAAASNPEVITAIRSHHEQLANELPSYTTAVCDIAEQDPVADPAATRDDLLGWYASELGPHIEAEEKTLYSQGSALAEANLLVRAMLDEHQVLGQLVHELSHATSGVRAAELAATIQRLFDLHLGKENDLLIPALDRSGIALGEILTGMHELVGERPASEETVASETATGYECGCTHDNGIDVRGLPPVQRHEAIVARLGILEPGQSLKVVNDHDPEPLRDQTEAQSGSYEWNYLENGPIRWQVEITRTR